MTANVDLIAIHVRQPRPGIVGPHPAIVDGLALRRRQVTVDAHEPDVGLGAPHLAIHEAHDVAAARLRVPGPPLTVLRIDALVGCVDLDHMSVAVDHQVGPVGHRLLLCASAARTARPYHESKRPAHSAFRAVY